MAADTKWAEYNCIDSAVTYKSWETLKDDLEKDGYMDYYKDVADMYQVLLFMMMKGIKVSRELLAETKKDVNDEIKTLQGDLKELTGMDLNYNSSKQCIQFFYGILGIPEYKNRKTGNPTTDDTALSRIIRKGSKGSNEAKIVQQLRNLSKLYSTYLSVEIDKDDRVRSFMNPRGTRMGRISSSQTLFGTGMNFQNLDPRFKKFLVADEGMMFIELDKKQSDWIITAYVSGDPLMIQVIENGEDPHAFTGSQISRLPIEAVQKESKIIGHNTDPFLIDNLRHEQMPELYDGTYPNISLMKSMSCRQAGKKGNHGCNFREGYKTFALLNEIMEAEAKTIVNTYRNTFIGLTAWWREIEAQLSKDRTLTNCYGQKYRFLTQWGDELFRIATSFIPQSTTAKIINDGLRWTYQDHSPQMLKADVLAQVHDSILFQYPIAHFGEMARTCHVIRDYINPTLTYKQRDFQIGTDMKIGLNWGDSANDNSTGMREINFLDNHIELGELLESEYASMSR